MKKELLLIVLIIFLLSGITYAQDIITLKNYESIPCRILTISKDSISFIRSGDSSGSAEKIGRSNVFMVHLRPESNGFDVAQGISMPGEDGKKDTLKADGGPWNACYSMLFPGTGNYFVRDRHKPWWIIGTITYGLVGSGLYYKFQSEDLYQTYWKDEYATSQDYQKANDYHHRYLLLTGLGCALWAGDIISTSIKGFKNQNARKSIQKSPTQSLHFRMNPAGEFGLVFSF